MKHDVYCRIWAIEQDPNTGEGHWCHAEFTGLKGRPYQRDNIEKVLAEKPVQIKRMKWKLVRCQPTHDGSACQSCEYKPFIDAPGYFHD